MKFVFLFLAVFSYKVYANDSRVDQQVFEDHPLYNTLYGTDCAVPEGTQVVHYPMIHPPRGEDSSRGHLFMSAIPRSSFNFIQWIRNYPQALVFDEPLWTNQLAEKAMIELTPSFWKMNPIDQYRTELDEMRETHHYQDLSLNSRRLLTLLTGGEAAFALGIIQRLYPTTLKSSIEEVEESYFIFHGITDTHRDISLPWIDLNQKLLELAEQFHQEKTLSAKEDIKQQMRQTYDDVLQLEKLSNGRHLFEWREQLLAEAVETVLNTPENKNQMIVISYGMGHDLSDHFSSYNFYVLPYSCVIGRAVSSDFEILIVLMFQYQVSYHLFEENVLSILHQDILDRVDRLSSNDLERFQEYVKTVVKDRSLDVWSKEELIDQIKRALPSPFKENRFEKAFQLLISMNDEERVRVSQLLSLKRT